MFTPEVGTWYVVVTCEQCKLTIFLFPDLTNGQGVLHANYIVTCPQCNHKGAYDGRHYYHSKEQHDFRNSETLLP
jgi:hypothetical protein